MRYSTALAFAGLAAAAPAKVARQDPQDGEMHILPIDDSSSVGKKGIAFTPPNEWVPGSGLDHRLAEASGWGYTWDDPIEESAVGLHVVPMCWGAEKDRFGNPQDRCKVQSIANQIKESNDKWVLGYNEPDMIGGDHGGSDMTPKEAYDAWGRQMLPLKTNYHAKLVCPGISSYDTDVSKFTQRASGLTWLDQFVGLAGGKPNNLGCDAQAIHWYGEPGVGDAKDRAKAFTDYLEMTHEHVDQLFQRENMPLWVTEFGPEPGEAVSRTMLAEFLKIVIPWMNEKPWIARHSAFMAKLMVDGDVLNEAGNAFVQA